MFRNIRVLSSCVYIPGLFERPYEGVKTGFPHQSFCLRQGGKKDLLNCLLPVYDASLQRLLYKTSVERYRFPVPVD